MLLHAVLPCTCSPQITRGLLQKHGAERVRDTPITEVRAGTVVSVSGSGDCEEGGGVAWCLGQVHSMQQCMQQQPLQKAALWSHWCAWFPAQ